jgi:hypothetical protein
MFNVDQKRFAKVVEVLSAWYKVLVKVTRSSLH